MRKSSSQLLAEAMERTRKGWQAQFRTAAPAPEPLDPLPQAAWTIAISRDAGTDGSRVADAVAQQLGWLAYDHKLLTELADDLGVSVPAVEAVDERHKGWLRECADAFAAVPALSSSAYVHRLLAVLARLSAKGGCVILGRGGAQVLPRATTLRVRLVAPLDDRIANVQQKRGVSRKKAAEAVARVDGERRRFVHDHFHIDPTDGSGYDLVLNTSRFGLQDCAEIIVSALRRLEDQTRCDAASSAAPTGCPQPG